MRSRLLRTLATVALSAVAGSVVAGEAPLSNLMRYVKLDATRHVSGQPTVESFAQLKSAGISTVIDLRPDAETPDLDEKAVVEQQGLKYRSLAISGAADLTRENVGRFDQLLKETASGNVLIHCASGNRVGAMLALQARWIEGKSAEESLAIGKAAGMTGLTAEVQRLLEADNNAGEKSR